MYTYLHTHTLSIYTQEYLKIFIIVSRIYTSLPSSLYRTLSGSDANSSRTVNGSSSLGYCEEQGHDSSAARLGRREERSLPRWCFGNLDREVTKTHERFRRVHVSQTVHVWLCAAPPLTPLCFSQQLWPRLLLHPPERCMLFISDRPSFALCCVVCVSGCVCIFLSMCMCAYVCRYVFVFVRACMYV